MAQQTKTDKAGQQIISRLGEISPEGLAAIIEAAQGLLDIVNDAQDASQSENDTRPAVSQRGYIEWKTIPHKTANGTQQYGPYAYMRRLKNGKLTSEYIGKNLRPEYQQFVRPGRGRPKKESGQ